MTRRDSFCPKYISMDLDIIDAFTTPLIYLTNCPIFIHPQLLQIEYGCRQVIVPVQDPPYQQQNMAKTMLLSLNKWHCVIMKLNDIGNKNGLDKLLKHFKHTQWVVQLIQQNKLMDTNYSFSGMTLTEIFEIQSLQSLFIKFWYLGLTSDSIIASEDASIFRAIRKSITFANCFTFEMPLRTYISYIDRIIQSLVSIEPRKTFDVLLGHLRNNKVISVSFQLFGVAFLQLFGRILQLLNTQMMNKILRKIFYEVTTISKMGVSSLKVKGIKAISFEELIPNFHQLLDEKTQTANNLDLKANPEQVSLSYQRMGHNKEYNVKTMKGRLQAQRQHNLEMRESEGEHYPLGQQIRNREKTNISCFTMGGFEVVDYSDSINQLHKKLLTKILLNK